jgi:hypothetical protein
MVTLAPYDQFIGVIRSLNAFRLAEIPFRRNDDETLFVTLRDRRGGAGEVSQVTADFQASAAGGEPHGAALRTPIWVGRPPREQEHL